MRNPTAQENLTGERERKKIELWVSMCVYERIEILIGRLIKFKKNHKIIHISSTRVITIN